MKTWLVGIAIVLVFVFMVWFEYEYPCVRYSDPYPVSHLACSFTNSRGDCTSYYTYITWEKTCLERTTRDKLKAEKEGDWK